MRSKHHKSSEKQLLPLVNERRLPPNQTKEGFFGGVSIPVNQKLSEILLQLHISEKSGRGVPRITAAYGEEAFQFKDNAISVTIPFARLNLGKTTQDTTQDISDKADVLNRILAFCKNAHSTKEITDHLGFKERKSASKYIRILLDQGRLARTIPEKPNSKYQKYITISE